MLRATLYIMACSGKNRLRRRLQRLREPRYLLGALVGSAYLYFSVFGRMRADRSTSNGGRRSAFLPLFGGTGPALAGLLLLLAAGVSFVMPFGSGMLDFSKTETEFLFPAPVSRRQLLLYRLMRSQWAVLLSAAIVALTFPLASPSARLRGLGGAWLLLMTCQVFYTGVTLSRRRSEAGTTRGKWIAWAPRLIVVGAIAVVAREVGQAIGRRAVYTLDDAVSLLVTSLATGLPHVIVWPFVAILQPLFADSYAQFLLNLPAALAIYGLAIAWVLSADEAFGALAQDSVERQSLRPARKSAAYHARPMAWILALHGRPETPFVWKAATQTFRSVDRRVLLRIILLIGWLTAAVTFASRARGLAQVVGLFSAAGALFTALMGPQMLRLDLRQDLGHLELLKTWPVRAAAIVRGEMIWPTVVITGVSWALGAVALVLSATAFERTGLALRLAAGWAVMILVPALVLAQFTIHNAAALIFPAWIVPGGRPRGLDAMGQRLIMLSGTLMILVLAVAPGALVGGILWFAFFRFVGPWVLIPAAVIAASMVTVEALMATEALGPAYERLDLTSVERSESP